MPNTHSTLTALFSDIADAIRSKTGGSASIAASAFPSAIAAIPTGPVTSGTSLISITGIYDISSYSSVSVNVTAQDLFYAKIQNGFPFSTLQNSLITKVGKAAFAEETIDTISFPNCSVIEEAGFWGWTGKVINMENIESIGYRAFQVANYLSRAYFPKCTFVDSSAFLTCSNLSYASFSSGLTSILARTFSSCTNLLEFHGSGVTFVDIGAFSWCTNLSEFQGSALTSISTQAFYACSKLNSVNLTNCTSLGSSAFQGCNNLTGINMPKVKTILGSAFRYCSKITELNIESCTTIGQYAFANCSGLTDIDLPGVTTISGRAFTSCNGLNSIIFSGLTTAYGSCFSNCINLKFASFANLKSVSVNMFTNCYNLLSLYLTRTTMTTLGNVNAFAGTPISDNTTSTGGVYGSIYVPASLYSNYIAATNWLNYADRFVSI